MKTKISAIAFVLVSALVLTGCGGGTESSQGQNLTVWLISDGTPSALQDYLTVQYKSLNGGNLWILEVPKDRIADDVHGVLEGEMLRPDLVEVSNTESPSLIAAGAFENITELYDLLGGDRLLQSFVEVGAADGSNYTLPYYFHSRFIYFRQDIWKEANLNIPPSSLTAFNQAAMTIAEKNPLGIKDFSGFFIAGQDWHDALAWIFANGGDIARKQADGSWVSTLSSPLTIEGLTQLQQLHSKACLAAWIARQNDPWLYLNDTDITTDNTGRQVKTKISAASIMSDISAQPMMGDLVRNYLGVEVRTWNDETFGVFALPGNNGKPAPTFISGSNIGVMAGTKHLEGTQQLLQIIYSREYQTMLAQNGMGPGNLDYWPLLGTDQFTRAMVDAATNSKLTPAAPGWSLIEDSGTLEEFFQLIAEGGDIQALTQKYDEIITPMLNGVAE